VSAHEPLPQVAANIRAAREAAGLSQVGLSERSGIALSHLNKLENARRDPTTHTLLRIARALDISLSELLEGIR
jgi:transcriptional regulator with XRE-family HTH domain